MSNSRRTFIKQSSAVLAGAALLPSIHLQAQAGNTQKIGIQLFALEKEMMNDAKNTLKCLKESGYQYIEHSNYDNRTFYGFTPSDFRKLVSDSGLMLISGHTVLEHRHWNKKNKNFTSEWQHVVADASIAGQEFLITPWLDKSLWNNESGLKHFIEVLNKCGELCRKSGIKFGYHNHDFEFTHYIKNRNLYDIILQYTDQYLVTQQLDIGNVQHAAMSVVGLLNKYPGRFKMMHVKNLEVSAFPNNTYKTTPLDSGILNLADVISAARVSGTHAEFIIDPVNDRATSAIESARLDIKSMRQFLDFKLETIA